MPTIPPLPTFTSNPGDYSDSCTAPTATIADGYGGSSTYAKLRVQQNSTQSTQVCFRVNNGSAELTGGDIVVSTTSPGTGTPTVDSNASACQNTSGNLVPGPHPLFSATLLGSVPVLVDTYSNGGAAWVCLVAGSVQERVVVPVPGAAVPAVAVNTDSPSVPAPSPTQGPVGYPSSTCQTGAGSGGQVADTNVGGVQLFAFDWLNGSAAHLCARVQGPVNAGGMLTLDTTGSPGITPVLTTSTDLTPCTQPIIQIASPVQVTLAISSVGANPASLCVSADGVSERLTAGATGAPVAPSVSWTPDPDTP